MAVFISMIEIVIASQRVSLRENIRLTADFFEKRKKIWEIKLAKFPNEKKIVNEINNGKYVTDLFDRGSFSLAVLWSCNVMEKVIDAAAEGITSKNADYISFFKKEDGKRERYPEQMRNLGYRLNAENTNDEKQMTLEHLWHNLRNDIAHRNYMPTFEETFGALIILCNFMSYMPETLLVWDNESISLNTQEANQT
jgi:hypothetical protein